MFNLFKKSLGDHDDDVSLLRNYSVILNLLVILTLAEHVTSADFENFQHDLAIFPLRPELRCSRGAPSVR